MKVNDEVFKGLVYCRVLRPGRFVLDLGRLKKNWEATGS